MDENGNAHLRRSVSSCTLGAEPSCIEFAPSPQPLFIVGTYTLQKNDAASDSLGPDSAGQVRKGQLLVFRLERDLRVTALLEYTVDGAVLDIHFAPQDQNVFAVAQSNGFLNLWRLVISDGGASLEMLQSLRISDPSILVLSLAWSSDSSSQYQIAATLSDGSLCAVSLDEDWAVVARVSIVSHTLEAWTIAWSIQSRKSPGNYPDQGQETRVYSGGDDAVICKWKTSILEQSNSNKRLEAERYLADVVPEQRLKGTNPYAVEELSFDKATHDAGVTSILPLPDCDDEIIVTGSYDEHVRVLSPRPRGRWLVHAEKRLGGGVWRLKLLWQRKNANGLAFTVMASCMHAGPRILTIQSEADAWSINVIARFEEHESMNYGSDGRQMADESGMSRPVIVSTSFYDRRLCVWTAESY